MSNYRMFYTSFWTDPKIMEEFTPQDRYFYIYLLTNAHTNICGCYELGPMQMSNETGYDYKTVVMLLERLSVKHNVIRYSPGTKEVCIVNWHKYNWTRSEKLLTSVKKVAAYIKSEDFKRFVLRMVDETDTVSVPYQYPMDTSNSNSYSNSYSNSNSNKGERVKKELKDLYKEVDE